MKCRVCGCTDDRACFDILLMRPCHWVVPGLCSLCARTTQEDARRDYEEFIRAQFRHVEASHASDV